MQLAHEIDFAAQTYLPAFRNLASRIKCLECIPRSVEFDHRNNILLHKHLKVQQHQCAVFAHHFVLFVKLDFNLLVGTVHVSHGEGERERVSE